jgi:hypothetical protein
VSIELYGCSKNGGFFIKMKILFDNMKVFEYIIVSLTCIGIKK